MQCGGQWRDLLLLDDDGSLVCWACLRAERGAKKEARDGDMANQAMH